MPPPDPELIEAASARLDAEDLPIVGMLLARVRVDDIATTLGVEPREVRARALRIIGEMQAHDRRRGHVSRDGSVNYSATKRRSGCDSAARSETESHLA